MVSKAVENAAIAISVIIAIAFAAAALTLYGPDQTTPPTEKVYDVITDRFDGARMGYRITRHRRSNYDFEVRVDDPPEGGYWLVEWYFDPRPVVIPAGVTDEPHIEPIIEPTRKYDWGYVYGSYDFKQYEGKVVVTRLSIRAFTSDGESDITKDDYYIEVPFLVWYEEWEEAMAIAEKLWELE